MAQLAPQLWRKLRRYKCGAWRDVAWFEKPIAPYDQNPEPIRPVGDIPAEALAAILKRYEAEQP